LFVSASSHVNETSHVRRFRFGAALTVL